MSYQRIQPIDITRGIALVELIVGIALVSVIMLAIVGLAARNIRLSQIVLENVQADFLVEEGIEAIKLMRNDAWTNLTALAYDQEYGLAYVGTSWTATTASDTTDGFTRTFVLSEVTRDINDDIADTGTIDTQTLLVNVDVAWASATGERSRALSFYITDFFSETYAE